MSSDISRERFLNSPWFCYKLSDWSLPYGDVDGYCILLQFIKGFKDFSPHCEVKCTSFGLEHLMCSEVVVTLKPRSRQLFKERASQKQSSGKRKRNLKGSKSRSGQDDTQEYDANSQLDDVALLAKSDKTFKFKVCLDCEGSTLFTSRLLSGWLQRGMAAALGVDNTNRKEGGNGCLRVPVYRVKGDPRQYLQLTYQRGTQEDRISSNQALMEHEWLSALSARGRASRQILGDVTRELGAMPSLFPIIRELSVTAKNVLLSSRDKNTDANVPQSRLQTITAELAKQRFGPITIHLSSPSLLHLYYNTSYEYYAGGKMLDGTTAIGLKSKKKNVDGVVKKTPIFLQKLRSSATLKPIMEYE